ncbi:MAG: hypothetical protein MI741_06445, partial [Rhodospirillales bacterium]|nr:hypothetical protein [Rhodospirillales bacterium]
MAVRLAALWAIAALAMSVTGCASIVSDNESNTYIQTDPEEARCELHGQDFKRVVNTPGSVQLPAAAAPVTIACEAPGFQATTESLDTEMDGWILGNIIFGGVVGVVVDAATGAGEKFPPRVMIFLEPEAFVSEQDRNEWYDRRRTALEEEWQKKIQIVRTRCSQDTGCDGKIARIEKARDEKLAELEERRLRARISAAGTPTPAEDVAKSVAPPPEIATAVPPVKSHPVVPPVKSHYDPSGKWRLVLKRTPRS